MFDRKNSKGAEATKTENDREGCQGSKKHFVTLLSFPLGETRDHLNVFLFFLTETWSNF